ncbi:MAG: TVP38/TMEM64 family protein [Deltaproteobacteria bacterium]|nr:MAG: TVP38/TMEM64 family protein [Deltaproteobacteria bacterium]
MEKNTPLKPSTGRGKGLLKAIVLLVFIVAAVTLIRYTPVRQSLTAEAMGRFLREAGLWAPVVYMVIYAAGVCLFLPGTLLTGLGAAVFGPYRGFLYVWIGAMAGASLAFLIGRTLGRDFAASMVGDRLRKYDDAIERSGFATVLYLRLVYFPFTPMNFGMGLTKVRFRDYFAGTGLGIIVGTFIFTFFIGTLKEVWTSGDWSRLWSFKVYFSLGLFVFSFFIPKIIKKLKGENAGDEAPTAPVGPMEDRGEARKGD